MSAELGPSLAGNAEIFVQKLNGNPISLEMLFPSNLRPSASERLDRSSLTLDRSDRLRVFICRSHPRYT